MSADEPTPHTHSRYHRTYTDARGGYTDRTESSDSCTCGIGENHEEMVGWTPYVPPAD
jgi:hypothetical protein